jgi:hypothetical protein
MAALHFPVPVVPAKAETQSPRVCAANDPVAPWLGRGDYCARGRSRAGFPLPAGMTTEGRKVIASDRQAVAEAAADAEFRTVLQAQGGVAGA